jgi:hypothetical protein
MERCGRAAMARKCPAATVMIVLKIICDLEVVFEKIARGGRSVVDDS